MISINVTANEEFFNKFYTLDDRMKKSVREKLNEFGRMIYEKVLENLSGKVLQVRTGNLLGSIRFEEAVSDENPIVSIYTTNPYASVHEFGGKGYYTIVASKSEMLKFFWEKEGVFFRGKSVNHPPALKRSFMLSALTELAPELAQNVSTIFRNL